jgi:hypothetical protein
MVDKVLSELAVSGGPFVLIIDDLHELSSGYGENAWASSAWEARLFVNPITSSPGGNPPTPAPTSSTTPARSLPLPGRERRREQLHHRPRADDRLTGVDASRLHPYEDLPVPGHRAFHLVDPQHVDPAELVVPDCLYHDLSPLTR